jgi:ubiquitin-protein ligase E3 C
MIHGVYCNNASATMICYVVFSDLYLYMIIIQHKVRNSGHFDSASVLEQVLMLVASHVGHHPCCCLKVDPRWSFSSQLLSIPFLWHRLPHLKKVSVSLNIFVWPFFWEHFQ